ncbi:glutaredoxin family protein [Spiribacter sp. 2438]|uniref:glutaredoxin family protein n=1 Tax=Spiribacter sp. 2438 TaxID=2666185 RepID=UPI001E49A95E|nr:glutaredoxin family protein [Spiribacter sp. 2438]
MHFYTTEGCRLCDEALQWVIPIMERLSVKLEVIEIMDEASLEKAYGERIPVLAWSHGAESLDWPFDRAAVYRFGMHS